MGEGGREGGSSQQQPDVGPLRGCGYGDISLYFRGMRVVVKVLKVLKIDRCIGVCIRYRRSIIKKIIE